MIIFIRKTNHPNLNLDLDPCNQIYYFIHGNSEKGAHVRNDLHYSICLRHAICSRTATKRIFLRKGLFFICSHHVLNYPCIYNIYKYHDCIIHVSQTIYVIFYNLLFGVSYMLFFSIIYCMLLMLKICLLKTGFRIRIRFSKQGRMRIGF